MTLFEALTAGAFDRLNWQHSGEFEQKFSKKSNAPVSARGWAVLELTGTLLQASAECRFILQTGGVNVERTFWDGVRLIWGTLNTGFTVCILH